jgi:hypothetical protein
MRRLALTLLTLSLTGLAGCDQLGIESASQTAARREAEGKAVGAGCRHAARSVEACYALNKKADKASVFTGWKEMNEYMTENKIEAVPPPPEPATVAAAEDAGPEPKKVAKADTKKAGAH